MKCSCRHNSTAAAATVVVYHVAEFQNILYTCNRFAHITYGCVLTAVLANEFLRACIAMVSHRHRTYACCPMVRQKLDARARLSVSSVFNRKTIDGTKFYEQSRHNALRPHDENPATTQPRILHFLQTADTWNYILIPNIELDYRKIMNLCAAACDSSKLRHSESEFTASGRIFRSQKMH